jgi:poly-gamma-glutamate capsule biosynthesis protein CapA/YwtB (metallophosphatase superfamily)
MNRGGLTMKKKFSAILLTVSALLAAVILYSNPWNVSSSVPASGKSEKVLNSSSSIPFSSKGLQYLQEDIKRREYTTEVSIISAGDILFHMPQVRAAAENGTYNFKPMFSEVKDIVSSKDIAVAVFETTINPKLSYSGYPSFNTPVQALEAVKDAGFNALVNAHNHSLDTGLEGLRSTNNFMKQYGFKVIGAGEPQEDKSVVIEKNNIKLGLLAYTYGTNYGIQYREMINYIDEVTIKKDIKNIKERCDFIIVYLHLGTEYVRSVETFQANLVKKVASMGADAILCSHPHVARKTEMIKVMGREVLVNYSMGNFISNQNDKYTDIGSMQNIVVEKRGSVTRLKSSETIPVYRLRYTSGGKTVYKTVPYNAAHKFNGVLNSNTLAYIEQVSKELAFTYCGEEAESKRRKAEMCLEK